MNGSRLVELELVEPILEAFKINPPTFISENDRLSEFLSISTIGTKQKEDKYLIPQHEDSCTTLTPDICEVDDRLHE